MKREFDRRQGLVDRRRSPGRRVDDAPLPMSLVDLARGVGGFPPADGPGVSPPGRVG